MKQHRVARRFEDRIAEDLGGRRVPFSGAGPEKGDVRSKQTYQIVDGRPTQVETMSFRIEAKTTAQPKYSFRHQDWIDITRSASAAMEIPVFAISFVRNRSLYQDFIIVSEDFAVQLGFTPEDEPFWVGKSITLHASDLSLRGRSNPPSLMFTGDRSCLVVLPYLDFVQRITDAG